MLNVLTTWQLIFPRARDTRESKVEATWPHAFYDLASKITCLYSFSQYIIGHTVHPYALWEETTQD